MYPLQRVVVYFTTYHNSLDRAALSAAAPAHEVKPTDIIQSNHQQKPNKHIN